MSEFDNKLQNITEYILNQCKSPENGLPEEVFLMVSALVPIANVDLFIINDKKEILLLWRDDEYFGKGWSIPGGCMRFGETLEDRVHKTALNELGQDVSIIRGPITAIDVIRGANFHLKFPNTRGHNITIPFLCKLSTYMQPNKNLKWFSKIPEDILEVHHVYDVLFKKLDLMI